LKTVIKFSSIEQKVSSWSPSKLTMRATYNGSAIFIAILLSDF